PPGAAPRTAQPRRTSVAISAVTGLPLGHAELERVVQEELGVLEDPPLQTARTTTRALIDDAARHLIEAGGKRLRPMLVILSAQFGEGVDDRVRQAAVATELTHLASLYHDDVMDSAPLRRGAPSAHEVW